MKHLITILLSIFSLTSMAQFPVTHSQSNNKTNEQFNGAINPKKGVINGRYTDTATANLDYISKYAGAQIVVGNTFYIRDSTATKWLLTGSGGGGSYTLPIADTNILGGIKVGNNLTIDRSTGVLSATGGGGAIANGLNSIGGITLVDSTVTLLRNIVWTINGVVYTQVVNTSFIIHTADSGYFRRDLIYADTSGYINKLQGIEDTAIATAPVLPPNSVVVTIVDVYGSQIINPTPLVIGTIPTWNQTMVQSNSTTQRAIINYNGGGYGVTLNSVLAGFAGFGMTNTSSAIAAAIGVVGYNDLGHIMQFYQGSSTNFYAPDQFLLRGSGTGGVKVVADSGDVGFYRGMQNTIYPQYRSGAFKPDGSFVLDNYKNNIAGDSVLSTDVNGKVINVLKGSGGIGCAVTFYVTPDSLYLVKDSCGSIVDSTQFVGDGGSGGGGASQNFANTNLTATGDRVHNFGVHSLAINFNDGTNQSSVTNYPSQSYSLLQSNDGRSADYQLSVGESRFGLYNVNGVYNAKISVETDNFGTEATVRLATPNFIKFNSDFYGTSPYNQTTSDFVNKSILLIDTTSGSEESGKVYRYTGTIPIFKTGTPTSSSDSQGVVGDQLYDDNYLYIKTSAGWKRTALTSF